MNILELDCIVLASEDAGVFVDRGSGASLVIILEPSWAYRTFKNNESEKVAKMLQQYVVIYSLSS